MSRALVAAASDVASQIQTSQKWPDDTRFIAYDPRFETDSIQLDVFNNGISSLQDQEAALIKTYPVLGPTQAPQPGSGQMVPHDAFISSGNSLSDVASLITAVTGLFKESDTNDEASISLGDAQSFVLSNVKRVLKYPLLYPSAMPLNDDDSEDDPISAMLDLSQTAAVWSSEYNLNAETGAALSSALSLNADVATLEKQHPNLQPDLDVQLLPVTSIVKAIQSGLQQTPAVQPSPLQFKILTDAATAVDKSLGAYPVIHHDLLNIESEAQTIQMASDVAAFTNNVTAYAVALANTNSAGETTGMQIYRGWLFKSALDTKDTYVLYIEVQGLTGGDWAASYPLSHTRRSASGAADLSYMVFDTDRNVVTSGSCTAYAPFTIDSNTLYDNVTVRETENPKLVGAPANPQSN